MPKNTRRHSGGRARIAAHRLEDFLVQLGETGSVTEAALRCRLRRSTLYALRKSSRSFARHWKEALDQGVDRLQDGAMSYAINGHARPVWYRGQQVGASQHFDSRLMQFLLKAHRPELYNRSPEPMAVPNPHPPGFDLVKRVAAAEKRAAAHRREKAEAARKEAAAALNPTGQMDKA
jgi:hypothetical protein